MTMAGFLEGKTAFITGAGRGIGEAIAHAFAQQGCNIAAVARTKTEVEDTARTIREAGGQAIGLACDVADAEQVQIAVNETHDSFGAIDILVNNAGVALMGKFHELNADIWRTTMDVNLHGAVHCIQAVLPGMMHEKSGRIINISSVAGVKPMVNQSAYCASKHALQALSHVLAMELREYNIAVHNVCPGGVTTKLADDAMPDRDKSDWMTPDDIAHACLFLATQSDRATTDDVIVRRFASVPIGG
jgi:3-oxoacyl-[acyl-carrier protein] reductase